MDEIDAMKAVDESMAALAQDAQRRVLTWAWSKYFGLSEDGPKLGGSQAQKSAKKGGSGKSSGKSATSSSGKKTIISMDKSLDLNPTGKVSAEHFASEKKPANAKEKCVVACYYLRDIVEVEQVNVSGVYTFFKHIGWPLPSNLKNMLQQAGSSGWLDTADADNILITSTGENLVEHKLPKSKD